MIYSEENEKLRKIIGKRIRQCREDKDISQKELSEKMNVTQNAVSSWEIGRTSPTRTTLKSLSTLFGVDFAWLSGEDVPIVIEPDYSEQKVTIEPKEAEQKMSQIKILSEYYIKLSELSPKSLEMVTSLIDALSTKEKGNIKE